MKKGIIAILTVLLSILSANADSKTEPDSSQTVGRTILHHKKTDNPRPNAPSRVVIECSYGLNFIEFQMPEGANTLSVTVYNDDESFYGVVLKENPVFYTPQLNGEYMVQCVTDDGRVFAGTIEL